MQTKPLQAVLEVLQWRFLRCLWRVFAGVCTAVFADSMYDLAASFAPRGVGPCSVVVGTTAWLAVLSICGYS